MKTSKTIIVSLRLAKQKLLIVATCQAFRFFCSVHPFHQGCSELLSHWKYYWCSAGQLWCPWLIRSRPFFAQHTLKYWSVTDLVMGTETTKWRIMDGSYIHSKNCFLIWHRFFVVLSVSAHNLTTIHHLEEIKLFCIMFSVGLVAVFGFFGPCFYGPFWTNVMPFLANYGPEHLYWRVLYERFKRLYGKSLQESTLWASFLRPVFGPLLDHYCTFYGPFRTNEGPERL